MNPQAWHDFFILTGTAAATLLGLVFVAASIAATIPNEKLGDERSRTLWVLPIVYAFVRVLVVSAIGVIPGQTAKTFGYCVSALAVLDLLRTVRVALSMQVIGRAGGRRTASEWFWYLLYPTSATLAIATTGFALMMGWYWPPAVLAGGLLAHLVIGVHNAWELAQWLATRQ